MSTSAPRLLGEPDQYVQSGAWRQKPLGQLLWEWADKYHSSTAIVDGSTRLTYLDLAQRADAVAEALDASGLRRGDTFLVQLPNCWEFVVIVMACQRIGVAAILSLMSDRERDLCRIANVGSAKGVAVVDRYRDFDHQSLGEALVDQIGAPCPPLVAGENVHAPNIDVRTACAQVGDWRSRRHRLDRLSPDAGHVAIILLSGGTTGEPKLVRHTHNDYEHTFRSCGDVCALNADTVYLAVLPVAHNFSLASPGILGVLAAGGTAVMSPSANPEKALKLIHAESVTMTAVVPAVAQRWLAHIDGNHSNPIDLATLVILQVGGSVTPPDLAERLTVTLAVTVQQVYGMSEGLVNLTRLDDPSGITFKTQGRPASAFDEIRIVNDAGEEVTDGQVGELITKGPSVSAGYVGLSQPDPPAHARDGWYRTGDLVRQHACGNLIVVGRLKDVVNRGGEKIALSEVESVLREMDGVREATAIAWPHAALGECVGVAVIADQHSTPTLDAVRRHFRDSHVASHKAPEVLFEVDELPLTGMGKIDRRRLRQFLLDKQIDSQLSIG